MRQVNASIHSLFYAGSQIRSDLVVVCCLICAILLPCWYLSEPFHLDSYNIVFLMFSFPAVCDFSYLFAHHVFILRTSNGLLKKQYFQLLACSYWSSRWRIGCLRAASVYMRSVSCCNRCKARLKRCTTCLLRMIFHLTFSSVLFGLAENRPLSFLGAMIEQIGCNLPRNPVWSYHNRWTRC